MFEADRSAGTRRWPLVRFGQNSHTRVTLLSTRFFEVTTHWVGQTVLCPGDGCELCELVPARGLFYLAVSCQSRVSLLELGSSSASQLEQHLKLLHGGFICGHVLELVRRGKKQPVMGECVETLPNIGGVTHRDLMVHVMTVFKMPAPNPAEDDQAYERRVAAMVRRRNERAVTAIRKGDFGRV